VMLYASLGGAKAVDNTNFLQFLIIMGGMFIAFFTIVRLLPAGPRAARLREVEAHLDQTWFSWIGGHAPGEVCPSAPQPVEDPHSYWCGDPHEACRCGATD